MGHLSPTELEERLEQDKQDTKQKLEAEKAIVALYQAATSLDEAIDAAGDFIDGDRYIAFSMELRHKADSLRRWRDFS